MFQLLENAGSCRLDYNNFEELTHYNDCENSTVAHNLLSYYRMFQKSQELVMYSHLNLTKLIILQTVYNYVIIYYITSTTSTVVAHSQLHICYIIVQGILEQDGFLHKVSYYINCCYYMIKLDSPNMQTPFHVPIMYIIKYSSTKQQELTRKLWFPYFAPSNNCL